MLLLVLLSLAWADDRGAVGAVPVAEVSIGGDVKSFFLAGVPRSLFRFSADSAPLLDAMGMSADEALLAYGLGAEPFGQGVLATRLKGTVKAGILRFDLHWTLAAETAGTTSSLPGIGTGVGLAAPELLPLTWTPNTGDGLWVQHRIDRLVASVKLEGVDLAIGRQPVSFGSGRFFTPLDLVNPFGPATIDTEYKPGVDALRVDLYAGVSSRLTLVGAWAGDPLFGDRRRDADTPVLDDLVLAASGQTTVGVTDLLAFLGAVHAEPVVGLGTVSALGPVGVHGEATLSFPANDDAFVRAVLGADGRPTTTTTLSVELYAQTLGAADPSDYLEVASDPRFTRGELWQMGQLYGALAVAQELGPLVSASAAVIANLRDPSALLSLGGAWSVADDADVAFGGSFGLGAPPDPIAVGLALDPATGAPTLALPGAAAVSGAVRSEFGLYPTLAYVQVRAYF